jgi:hypothetical protein
MCEKTVKRRLARSLPLNIMTAAARLDEAVDEQGVNAWIAPDRGVVIDGEAMPHHDSHTPDVNDLIPRSPSPSRSDPAAAPQQLDGAACANEESATLAMLDNALAEAAKRGAVALQEAWTSVPKVNRSVLKVALDRRHKPAAAAADEEAS